MKKATDSSRSVISEVNSYISGSGERGLPAEVVARAKYHILDTLAAIVSGATLKPGQVARKYAEGQLGVQEGQIICSPMVTSAVNATFANAMAAHADETDDFRPDLGFHPGCIIVPAALSIAERERASGMSFLKGVVVGYDIGCHFMQAAGPKKLRETGRNAPSFGGTFGAAAAAASILRLKDDLVRHVLSYAARQTAGLNYWPHEKEHTEKAFVFAALPSRNGVTAALLAQSGFTGVWDSISGENSFFECISPDSRPELLAEGLGSRYDIMLTWIKKYPVGGPIQAAMDALLRLIEKHGLRSQDVQSLVVYMPQPFGDLDNSIIPNINPQYLLAVTLLDGKLTFEASHSHQRMNDPAVIEVKSRIKVAVDKGLLKDGGSRQAIVEVVTKDGTIFKEHVIHWRGRPENPMTTEEVEKKCENLLTPVLGADRSQKLINKIWNLEQVSDLRELRPLLSGYPAK